MYLPCPACPANSARARPEVMTIGLKSVRELCLRCPLVMEGDLLQDLTAYKKFRDKEVRGGPCGGSGARWCGGARLWGGGGKEVRGGPCGVSGARRYGGAPCGGSGAHKALAHAPTLLDQLRSLLGGDTSRALAWVHCCAVMCPALCPEGQQRCPCPHWLVPRPKS